MFPDSLQFIERDWLSSNSVLLFDGHDATVVDTGYDKHRETTRALVAHAINMRTEATGDSVALKRIVNTHLHSDHCGGNALLQDTWNCRITVPKACFEMATQWQQMVHQQAAQRCEQFVPDDALDDGDTFTAGGLRWEAFAAPGHDPTSLMFFAAQPRILISADALWEHGFGLTFPELKGESGFAEQADVLDLIESLNPAIVIPGHGAPFSNLARSLSEARSRLAAMQDNPDKNYRLALKILVKFMLLEHEEISIEQLQSKAANASIMRVSAERLNMTLFEGIQWAADELVKGGQINRRGDLLLDA